MTVGRGLAGRPAEIRQRRLEQRVVVVVDRDGLSRGDGAQGLDSLPAVHGQQDPGDPGPAQVDQAQVDVAEPLRDLADAVMHEGVARDVQAQPPLPVAGEVQQAAHHRRHDVAEWPGRVLAGQRRHPYLGVAVGVGDDPGLPGRQRHRRPESLLAQLAGGVRLGDDRQVVIEVPGGDPVEVVTVVVRQDYEVERRQLADGQGRLSQPLRGQAHADVGALASVQEVGVGEDGEARDLDKSGRGPDEGDLVGASAGPGDGRRDPRSFGHGGSPPLGMTRPAACPPARLPNPAARPDAAVRR